MTDNGEPQAQGSWHPDPTGRNKWRWQSSPGVWTDTVSDGTSTSTDPMRPTQPPDATDPAHQNDETSARSRATTADPSASAGRASKAVKRLGIVVAAVVVLLVVVAVIGAIAGDDSTGDSDSDRTVSSAPQSGRSLTEREIECARDYAVGLEISRDRMMWLQDDRSREGIFSWSNGHWVSYEKIMSDCTPEVVREARATSTNEAVAEASEAACRQKIDRAQFFGESWAREGQTALTAGYDDATLAYDVAILTYDQMLDASLEARDCATALGWDEVSQALDALIDEAPDLRRQLVAHCEAAFAASGFIC